MTPKWFSVEHNKDRLMLSWKWPSLNCTRDQRTDVTTKRIFPPTWQPSILIWKIKPPSFPFISLFKSQYINCLGCTKGKQYIKEHHLCLQWICMYRERKTCESSFKSVIYKCLFYLSVVSYPTFQSQMSVCLPTFLSSFETCTYLHIFPLQTYRHSAGGVMRGSCYPPDI